MSRIARLAATKGGKTRAIIKLAGRGAILLTLGTFNLAMWIFWAVLTVFGFASSLKRMTERATERYCACRKLRRARNLARHEREEREPHDVRRGVGWAKGRNPETAPQYRSFVRAPCPRVSRPVSPALPRRQPYA
jgi:hypothetical protein